jgi:hypothetical protein
MKINSVTVLHLVFIPCGARATLRLLHKQVAMFLWYELSFVIMLHSDDDFSLGTSFSIVPESFGDLT